MQQLLIQDVELSPPPSCNSCGCKMVDSGMTDVTESLSVIPKQYLIKRQHLHKYCCKSCHGGIATTPYPPRIKSGSSYDDELIIDVSLSKYCDLIPIERYCKMAARQGFPGLPPHSMIELTHYLADFLRPVYNLIRKEVQSSRILHADETPHKMLEGSSTANWYLWGFSNMEASYFECHGSRSGNVAWKFLQESKCQYLMSDVFSGYIRQFAWLTKAELKKIYHRSLLFIAMSMLAGNYEIFRERMESSLLIVMLRFTELNQNRKFYLIKSEQRIDDQ